MDYLSDKIDDIRTILKDIDLPKDSAEMKLYRALVDLTDKIAQQQDIVILDDSINCEITNTNAPLSYAWLIKSYIEGLYPYEDIYEYRCEYHYDIKGRESRTLTKVLKKIKLDGINKQFRLGLDYNS